MSQLVVKFQKLSGLEQFYFSIGLLFIGLPVLFVTAGVVVTIFQVIWSLAREPEFWRLSFGALGEILGVI